MWADMNDLSSDDGWYEIARYRFKGNGPVSLRFLPTFSYHSRRFRTDLHSWRRWLGSWSLHPSIQRFNNHGTDWRRFPANPRPMRCPVQLRRTLQPHRTLRLLADLSGSTNPRLQAALVPVRRRSCGAPVPCLPYTRYAAKAVAEERHPTTGVAGWLHHAESAGNRGCLRVGDNEIYNRCHRCDVHGSGGVVDAVTFLEARSLLASGSWSFLLPPTCNLTGTDLQGLLSSPHHSPRFIFSYYLLRADTRISRCDTLLYITLNV